MRRLVYLVLAAYLTVAPAGEPMPAGEFENGACLECHQRQNAGLVAAWRNSVHGAAESTVTCAACHGNSHRDAAARARRDETCIDCHGGKKNPVVHSYATSKHGILVLLEQEEWDWSRRLASANYRAPGCAYCHMHDGNHDVGAGVRSWKPAENTGAAERERVQDAMRVVCQDCHSPRYITRLFDNGERMLDIGRMKVREAADLIAQAAGEFSEVELAAANKQLVKMQSKHLKNLYLGVGHQSPDYQWWHGHPALDGDLLHIKGAVGALRRGRQAGK